MRLATRQVVVAEFDAMPSPVQYIGGFHYERCSEPSKLRSSPPRTMASSKSLLEKKAQVKQSSQSFATTAWAYFRLTRLHKFPAGSDLIFWPSGEHALTLYGLHLTVLAP